MQLLWSSWTLAELPGNDYKRQPGPQAVPGEPQTETDRPGHAPALTQYSHIQSFLTWSHSAHTRRAQEPPLSCSCCPGWDFLGAGSGCSRNGGFTYAEVAESQKASSSWASCPSFLPAWTCCPLTRVLRGNSHVISAPAPAPAFPHPALVLLPGSSWSHQ